MQIKQWKLIWKLYGGVTPSKNGPKNPIRGQTRFVVLSIVWVFFFFLVNAFRTDVGGGPTGPLVILGGILGKILLILFNLIVILNCAQVETVRNCKKKGG